MRWAMPVLNKLKNVRDVRLQLAEAAVSREDRELDSALARELSARRALEDGRRRSAMAVQQADAALVSRIAGGRSAISQWQVDRGRARRIVEDAQAAVADAVRSSECQRERCAQVRDRWRTQRLDVERLQAMIEQTSKVGARR